MRLVEHKISQMKAFGEFEHLNDAFLKLKDLDFFFLQSATAIFIVFVVFSNLGVIFFFLEDIRHTMKRILCETTGHRVHSLRGIVRKKQRFWI